MATVIHHMCIDVRGVLNWKAKVRQSLFRVDGKKPTDAEVKEFLYDKLKEGYEVIPFNGVECEGFDKINGCQGHVKDPA